MATPKKTPPINLSEMEDEEDVAEVRTTSTRQAGGLSYASGASKRPSFGSEGLKKIIWPVLISVLFTGILIFGFTPTKTDVLTLNDNLKEVGAATDATRAELLVQISDLRDSISAAVVEARSAKTALDGYAKKTDIPAAPDLTNYATLADLVTVDDAADVATLRAQITTLTSQLADLQAQVTALTTASTTSAATGDGVTVDLGYSKYLTWTDNTTSMTFPIGLLLQNETGQDVENLEIELAIHTQATSLPFKVCTVLDTYDFHFTVVAVSNGLVVIRGSAPIYGDGVSIAANRDETVYFNVQLDLDPTKPVPTTNIPLYVEASCKSYDYK